MDQQVYLSGVFTNLLILQENIRSFTSFLKKLAKVSGYFGFEIKHVNIDNIRFFKILVVFPKDRTPNLPIDMGKFKIQKKSFDIFHVFNGPHQIIAEIVAISN